MIVGRSYPSFNQKLKASFSAKLSTLFYYLEPHSLFTQYRFETQESCMERILVESVYL